jgi:two-component system repressor protein LuxO
MASANRLPLRQAARPSPIGVVIVDADAAQRRSLAGMIDTRGGGRFRATACASAEEAREAMRALPGAIVVADVETIGGPKRLAELDAHTIATSANASLTVAVDAIRAGARDFLPKPIGAKALLERLEQTLQALPPTASSSARPKPAGDDTADFAGFIGRSAAMQSVYASLRRVAASRAPVFLTGESGTGKELAADAIHALDKGDTAPFVALNCSAIPRDLLESEIFGHVRGAFTGATETRAGAAEMADGGTLFLDELAEMDVGLQAKLLRFVQDGVFRRVGSGEATRVDVRIISATNRDTLAEVAAGRLRADLFHRLHVLPVHLPPLRERGDDILLLADTFLERIARREGRAFAGFDPDAARLLTAYAWPGNVRELSNVVHRVVVFGDGGWVTAEMLPAEIRRANSAAAGVALSYAAQERVIIERAVAACDGDVVRAADRLAISPSTIYRKLQTWRTSG